MKLRRRLSIALSMAIALTTVNGFNTESKASGRLIEDIKSNGMLALQSGDCWTVEKEFSILANLFERMGTHGIKPAAFYRQAIADCINTSQVTVTPLSNAISTDTEEIDPNIEKYGHVLPMRYPCLDEYRELENQYRKDVENARYDSAISIIRKMQDMVIDCGFADRTPVSTGYDENIERQRLNELARTAATLRAGYPDTIEGRTRMTRDLDAANEIALRVQRLAQQASIDEYNQRVARIEAHNRQLEQQQLEQQLEQQRILDQQRQAEAEQRYREIVAEQQKRAEQQRILDQQRQAQIERQRIDQQLRGTYYPNCDAVGRTDISRYSPYYRPHLDGDNDGIACESNSR